jgi:hypothetical protein
VKKHPCLKWERVKPSHEQICKEYCNGIVRKKTNENVVFSVNFRHDFAHKCIA